MEGHSSLVAAFKKLEMERQTKVSEEFTKAARTGQNGTMVWNRVRTHYIAEMHDRAVRLADADATEAELILALQQVMDTAMGDIHRQLVRNPDSGKGTPVYCNEVTRWRKPLGVERDALVEQYRISLAKKQAAAPLPVAVPVYVDARYSHDAQIVVGNQTGTFAQTKQQPAKSEGWLKSTIGWLIALAAASIGLFKA